MRANVYVDGFNLYYSALRRRFPDAKWLDLRALAELLFANDEIHRVRYFTAKITARPDDPNQATRQQMYLRALATTDVDVHLGQFRHDRDYARRVDRCEVDGCLTPESVEVHKTEEKGSDVNLASHLLLDASRGECELAIIITNDTDLVEPIRIARDEFNITTALLCPSASPAVRLRQSVDVLKVIRGGPLQHAQFPAGLRDAKGEIHRPRRWRPPS